jgi:hypothetical protein
VPPATLLATVARVEPPAKPRLQPGSMIPGSFDRATSSPGFDRATSSPGFDRATPGASSKPPAPLADLRKSEAEQAAVVAEYQRQLDSVDLEALEEIEDQPTAAIDRATSSPRLYKPPSREASVTSRPNLEPVDEDTHRPENRRTPTQPPDVLSLAVDGITEEQITRAQAGASASATTNPQIAPPPSYSRASPSPVPAGAPGLFGSDRTTNLLAGVAVGLLLVVFPAKKLAQSYETRTVTPRLTDLQTSVAQPLAVGAGLVEAPEAIVASIEASQSKTRQRFGLIWLLVGVPLGLGLGFAPRFWD